MKKRMALIAAVAATILSIVLASHPARAEAQPAEVMAADTQAPAPEAAKPADPAGGDAEGSPAREGNIAGEEPAQISPDAPVAIVNGRPLSRAEYDRVLEAYVRNFRMMSGNPQGGAVEPNDAIKQEVIEQLVSRELLRQESLKYPDADQSAKVEEQYKGIQARFPTPEAFQEALKAQGLTEEGLRDLVDRQASVRYYVETQIAPKAVVPDEDIKKFYDENQDKFASPEQVKASHILIRWDAEAKPEEREKAKGKAEELRKRAAAGEDFAKLARENSEDPGSKEDGGDLGFFTRDRMVAPFAEAAFELKIGEVSGVVETQFGYHVIKCTDRKEAATAGFDEVKDNVGVYLRGQALDQAVQAKVQELKRAAKIDLVPSHL